MQAVAVPESQTYEWDFFLSLHDCVAPPLVDASAIPETETRFTQDLSKV